jgi:hypothetical protein
MAFGLVVAALAACLAFVVAYVSLALGSGPSLPGVSPAVALSVLAAPYAASLVLLATGRRSRGLALAGGTGFVAFLGLAPIAALFVLFARFASEPGQRRLIAWVVSFVALQLVLGLLAVVAHRALPAAQKRARAWRTGVGLALAYATLVFVGARSAVATRQAHQREHAARERAASTRLQALQRCARDAAQRAPDAGYPPDLATLAAGCPDAAGGTEAGGFRFSYLPGPTDDAGRIPSFVLCAQPLVVPETGVTTFAADAAGAIAQLPQLEEQGDAAKTPVSCATAWLRSGLVPEAVVQCLLESALRHPAAGYPADLEALVADGCLPRDAYEAPTQAGQPSRIGGAPLSYAPGEPGADGRVTRFAVRHSIVTPNGMREALLDEAGVDHVSVDDRPATRSDPSAAELEARACLEHGAGETCAAAGSRVAGGRGLAADPLRALDLYERGCAAGDARCCLLGGDLASSLGDAVPDPERGSRFYRRACEGGDATGCALWQQAARSGRGVEDAVP